MFSLKILYATEVRILSISCVLSFTPFYLATLLVTYLNVERDLSKDGIGDCK